MNNPHKTSLTLRAIYTLVLSLSLGGFGTVAFSQGVSATPEKSNARQNLGSGLTVKVAPDAKLQADPEKGWWFYLDPAEAEKKKEELYSFDKVAPPVPEDTAKEPENKCLKKETWDPSCGFIEPGKDFEFQEKQRDALLQSMVMNPKDSYAVEAFQQYNKWVMDTALQVAQMWQYNLSQNPELDPRVNKPINPFGLRIASQIRDNTTQELFRVLSKEGYLFYFSKVDCQYCHSMAPIINSLAKDTGLKVFNIALDGTCMPDYEQACLTGDDAMNAAKILKVSVVPTLYLYVEPQAWIRVANGLSSDDAIRGRIVNFVNGYKNALAQGLSAPNPGERAPMDFAKTYEQLYNGGTSKVDLEGKNN